MSVLEFERERHNQAGYFSLADVPQRGDVTEIAVSAGWPELDPIWKLYPGQFTVATGIAGHGKSTFLFNVLCNVAHDHGMKSFLYVPENEGHVRAKLERIWGVRRGFEKFASEQCFVQSAAPERYDAIARPIEWVLDRAENAIRNDGVDLLLIDPWNEIDQARPRDMLVSDYVGRCLRYLKQFCRTMEVAVIMVVHPTKAGVEQGKVPTLADCEGSMNWYNKADNGLIVHRAGNGNACKVISAKAREKGSGRRGECHFFVDAETEQFTPQTDALL